MVRCLAKLELISPVELPRVHTAAQERIIRPARNLLGSLRLPGDKSISHRYGMLAAFAEGTSHFSNFSTGADCASTLACMQALGATVTHQGDGVVAVTGVGGRVTPSAEPLDCGNSGSTMRMMSGLLAPQPGAFTLIGDASLSRRPMERIRKPLEQMGAKLTLTEGHAPITIEGGPLRAIDYTTPVPSAQVKTCVLLAGLQTAEPQQYAKPCAPAITANSPCAPSGPNSGAPWTQSPSKAPRRCTRSMLLCPGTSPRRRSFCVRQHCFPAPRWFWTRWASIPPARPCSTC